jgi:isopenicillin-N N-acyltransferase-like protein
MTEDTGKRAHVLMEGPPYVRGAAYGETLRAEIRELVGQWEAALARNTGVPSGGFITRFLAQTSYLSAIERHAPDLIEEVKGIAGGSGISFDTMFVFQLLDELILNAKYVAGHCSCIGVDKTKTKPALLGQNWDIESYVHGFQTVLHVKEWNSEMESLVFTYAGMIGAFGVNNGGIGVCVNSMPILSPARSGLPVAYVVRAILQRSTSEAAVRFVQDVPHASPQNYLIGDSQKITDLECSAGKVLQYLAPQGSGVVFHTNHPLVNDDYSDDYRALLLERERGQVSNELYHRAIERVEQNSGTRLASLEKLLGGLTAEEITVAKVKAVLASHDCADHPICADLGDAGKIASIVSTVIELSDDPRFHVAFGPPDITPYKTYSFSAKRETTNHITALDY